jgi:hypothetical protein
MEDFTMRSVLRLLATVTLVVFLGTGIAQAVGYERSYPENGVAAKTAVKLESPPGIVTALKEASMVGKIPSFVEDVATFVKDILSQFGILDKKAP